MEADSSDFVTIISSNLGKSVLNWYRAFVAECERVNMHATPKDFEYDLRERMSRLKQTNSIHDYVSKFQDLMSQTEIAISEMEKHFYFQNDRKHDVSIFIDNGSSLDGVSEELVKRLDLEVTEHELMKIDLGHRTRYGVAP
ncbi:Hypothetical protein PHPALM_21079 [Phytophthora palmivora]|uniref:Retrotransposon gag domain-containing protein n=1 Tax=Phytophthora palmivora TaxID=4796 RepID=A0A2P4XD88_9STRA|nr:Hypothetical protein PHPALM_21079 [Phytophthora palmivora]